MQHTFNYVKGCDFLVNKVNKDNACMIFIPEVCEYIWAGGGAGGGGGAFPANLVCLIACPYIAISCDNRQIYVTHSGELAIPLVEIPIRVCPSGNCDCSP